MATSAPSASVGGSALPEELCSMIKDACNFELNAAHRWAYIAKQIIQLCKKQRAQLDVLLRQAREVITQYASSRKLGNRTKTLGYACRVFHRLKKRCETHFKIESDTAKARKRRDSGNVCVEKKEDVATVAPSTSVPQIVGRKRGTEHCSEEHASSKKPRLDVPTSVTTGDDVALYALDRDDASSCASTIPDWEADQCAWTDCNDAQRAVLTYEKARKISPDTHVLNYLSLDDDGYITRRVFSIPDTKALISAMQGLFKRGRLHGVLHAESDNWHFTGVALRLLERYLSPLNEEIKHIWGLPLTTKISWTAVQTSATTCSQEAHTDYPPSLCGYRQSGGGSSSTAYSTFAQAVLAQPKGSVTADFVTPMIGFLAVVPGTKLVVWPGSHRLFSESMDVSTSKISPLCIELPVNTMLFARGDLIHADAAFETTNLCLRCFIDPSGVMPSDMPPHRLCDMAEGVRDRLDTAVPPHVGEGGSSR